MNTEAVSGGSGLGVSWAVNPFELLYRAWPDVAKIEGEMAIPHLVGNLRISAGRVVGFEVRAVAHERPTELVFADGNEVLFILPVRAGDGVEGAYLRIVEALRGAV
ncbi:hypothetical protein [Thermococcus sp. JdF3]|uniref:hypothetical protein n=1 Tax=Thermococcus sp. JdF3 TaxID=1638258 RepID=UPI00143A1F7F|nr:hypothetical protein [Thermococcus sp. JdF3]NJE00826.1 hypothetical protein [Thermococcus sp. JdF3]